MKDRSHDVPPALKDDITVQSVEIDGFWVVFQSKDASCSIVLFQSILHLSITIIRTYI